MTMMQTLNEASEIDVNGAPPPQTAAEILARAKAIVPRLRERSEEIERLRRLPREGVEMLRDTGVFRMGFRRAWGGAEVSSIEETEGSEVISYGDASAGWCAMIGMDTGLYAAFLEESVAREMFPSLDMITAGLLFPTGHAECVPGGYRLTRHRAFRKGVTHCDLVGSRAFIHRGRRP